MQLLLELSFVMVLLVLGCFLLKDKLTIKGSIGLFCIILSYYFYDLLIKLEILKLTVRALR